MALRPHIYFIPSTRMTVVINFLHCCFYLMKVTAEVAKFVLKSLGQDGVLDAYGMLHIEENHSMEEIKTLLITFCEFPNSI